MNLEVKNLMQTADLLLATLAYNSNMPRTYVFQKEKNTKKGILEDRKLLLPREDTMPNVLEKLLGKKEHESFLSQMGFSIFNEESKNELSLILNSLYEKYQGDRRKDANLLLSKIVIQYPEEQIQSYLNSDDKYFLESGMTFTQDFLNLNFLMQCKSKEKPTDKKMVLSRNVNSK